MPTALEIVEANLDVIERFIGHLSDKNTQRQVQDALNEYWEFTGSGAPHPRLGLSVTERVYTITSTEGSVLDWVYRAGNTVTSLANHVRLMNTWLPPDDVPSEELAEACYTLFLEYQQRNV